MTNATAIGNEATVNTSNTIQLGNSSVTDVFAGTSTTATLHTGGLQVTGGSPGVGKVLTSDATGTATWQAAGGGGWGLSGNSGTVDGTDFIGTTDNIPFNIRVNNQKSGRIDPTLANTFYGYQSGNSNTTGSNNTASGSQALLSNTTGSYNTSYGPSALHSNTTGNDNTAIGWWAMRANTTGYQNTGVGRQALNQNSTGINNAAIGFLALFQNTTGASNSANGSSALRENTTGSNNTASGYQALNKNLAGSNATAIGSGAMQYANDTSTPFQNSNVAVGFEALRGSTTAS
ncbi:MAG: hypothetical protein RLN96_12435, partial [Pseudomonadales bacterium]